jgi:hypothetical protein
MESGTLAYPNPGRSTNENTLFMMKKLISWVRPGVELVLTRCLRLTRVLISDDFPTLERPVKAISGKSSEGYWDGLTALLTNSADLMIMLFFGFYMLDT